MKHRVIRDYLAAHFLWFGKTGERETYDYGGCEQGVFIV
jgi:hypothetical protein